ncbi:MAG: GTP-dependent phosphoenolpyruvate carboxykinase, partial [Actinomycetota bacterium]
LTELESALA